MLQGDPLAFAVGKHPRDGCSTGARACLRDLDAVEHELFLGGLSQRMVRAVLGAHQAMTDVAVNQRNHQRGLRHRSAQQGRPRFGNLIRHAATLSVQVEPSVLGQGGIAALKRLPRFGHARRQASGSEHVEQPLVEAGQAVVLGVRPGALGEVHQQLGEPVGDAGDVLDFWL